MTLRRCVRKGKSKYVRMGRLDPSKTRKGTSLEKVIPTNMQKLKGGGRENKREGRTLGVYTYTTI